MYVMKVSCVYVPKQHSGEEVVITSVNVHLARRHSPNLRFTFSPGATLQEVFDEINPERLTNAPLDQLQS